MIIINYHEISPKPTSSPYVLSIHLFRKHIEVLVNLGFSFTTLTEILAEPTAEDHARQCAITFDDGRLGAYEYGAKLLQEHGAKATYFICPDWLEKNPATSSETYSDFMNWDQVAELVSRGNVIGSHGKRHLSFFDVDSETAFREVSDSKKLIERRLAAPCEHFASPYGHVNKAVMDLTRNCGYRTLSSTIHAPNKRPYDLFRLRRLDSANCSSANSFETEMFRCINEHAKFNVALLKLSEKFAAKESEANAIALFDLAVCLDRRSYDLCMEFGLPCISHDLPLGRSFKHIEEMLMRTHGEIVKNRQVVFTLLTFPKRHYAWVSRLRKLEWF